VNQELACRRHGFATQADRYPTAPVDIAARDQERRRLALSISAVARPGVIGGVVGYAGADRVELDVAMAPEDVVRLVG